MHLCKNMGAPCMYLHVSLCKKWSNSNCFWGRGRRFKIFRAWSIGIVPIGYSSLHKFLEIRKKVIKLTKRDLALWPLWSTHQRRVAKGASKIDSRKTLLHTKENLLSPAGKSPSHMCFHNFFLLSRRATGKSQSPRHGSKEPQKINCTRTTRVPISRSEAGVHQHSIDSQM